MNPPRTLYQKLWDDHCIEDYGDGQGLLWVDRQLLYEATSFQALQGLERRGLKALRPRASLAVPDHIIPTHHRDPKAFSASTRRLLDAMFERCAAQGIPAIPLHDQRQGIVHIIGPEQGFTLPGLIMVCCDSHTCTNGAFGALAFGIGSSEFEHVLATQTIVQPKLKSMRVRVTGEMGPAIFAKDIILAIIGEIGHDGGVGHSIEFAGPVVESLSMEGRMTICNMAIEAGARSGLIAPDDTTFAFVKGRPMAPAGADWDEAIAYWRTLPSDFGALFEKDVEIDVTGMSPRVTWGTSPEQVGGIRGTVPHPDEAPDAPRQAAWEAAQAYMDLTPGTALSDIRIDRAFIGSCTNARLDDLRAASEVVKGRKVADGVHAIVTPGSGLTRAAAEAEGLDRIFTEAGFEWRLPGCSMCFANDLDSVGAGERCASTSNRNFEHRQGVGARTHLMSPAMVAAAAVSGHLIDVRELIPLTPFTRLRGIAAPLPRRNVNTDDIYPNLGGAAITDPEAMGPCAFGNWRWNADGSPNPDFILNQQPYDEAVTLVAGANFGCGSARELAVWCMRAIGLRCIIAPSFSDIFYGNCLKNGMLPIRLSEGEVDVLTATIADPHSAILAIDLEARAVTRSDGCVLAFDISPRDRQRLLAGVDDIGATLAIMDEVQAFAADYHRRRPWLADAGGTD